jgi:pyruvate kinase
MKKTKIICSIGPASCSYEVMREMVLAGMNVARINFSHATLEERRQVEETVAKVNEDNTLEVIYPEIKYIGVDNTEHNGKDEREIQVTFNSGKSETVQIVISAFKESNKRIKNIA